MSISEILVKIINKKYKALQASKTSGIYDKINNFEGNAIGQIGEEFIEKLCKDNGIPYKKPKTVIHDEYDIIINGKKVEIKTARKGLKNNTLQFNGINPTYNYEYFIFIGLQSDNAGFLIIPGSAKSYVHRPERHLICIKGVNKKLVKMNPGNNVNYKLTLKFDDLDDISNLVDELRKIK